METKPRKRRSYVLNPATSTQRSQSRRAQLDAYAKSLGYPRYDTWDKLSTAILKSKAKVVIIEDLELSEPVRQMRDGQDGERINQ